ncbi:aldo-keto reductase family 1 member A1-like [Bacillus rossius redtenbacheri]|uniref:aldo-keto reductase family 1 member A1-like n=1 Tax=Bacillus rossius redtenbacheri TaxID=93214 RepID=UPI002FDC7FFD
MKYIKLHNGASMPAVGFGTWQAGEQELEAALESALEAGYRHIDTAYVYDNERAVGRVLARWLSSGRVARDELFVVTKLPPTGNRADRVDKYLARSLENLRLEHVDLYLVHVPFGFQERGDELHPAAEDGSILAELDTDHASLWKAMERQVAAGRARAIGLSNFNEAQLGRLLAGAEVPPACLQVEMHLYLQQRPLRAFCEARGIALCAYSPLGSRGTSKLLGKELPDLMGDPAVKEAAASHGRSPAQVLLRFAVQSGVAVIPKSTNPARIRENIQVFDFELTDEEMTRLADLDRGPAGRIVDFTFLKGIDKHPEFPF